VIELRGVRVEYRGPADPNDKQRVLGLLVAMYLDNAAGGDRSKQLAREIGALEKRLKEYDELRTRRDAVKKLLESAPGADEVTETVRAAIGSDLYTREYARIFDGDEHWKQLPSPAGG